LALLEKGNEICHDSHFPADIVIHVIFSIYHGLVKITKEKSAKSPDKD